MQHSFCNIQVVGGGSGGIASARRAAEFGVKVEHNKSRNNSEECFPLSKFVQKKRKGSRRFYILLSELLSLGGPCWGKPLGRHLRQCGVRPQEVDVVRSQVSRFCEASIKIRKLKWKPMSAFLDSRLRIWEHTICIFRTVWRQQCFISAQKKLIWSIIHDHFYPVNLWLMRLMIVCGQF